MVEIHVPRENVNDEQVVVSTVLFPSGAVVQQGDCLFVVETTKSSIEIESPIAGVIHHRLEEGDVVAVGAMLCSIDADLSASASTPLPSLAVKPEESSGEAVNVLVSLKARQRAQELGVDLSQFDQGIISVADIEKFAAAKRDNPENLQQLHNLICQAHDQSPIVIYGGGGHAKMCIDVVRQQNQYRIIGIVDKALPRGTQVSGVEVIGDDSMMQWLFDQGVRYVINAVGAVVKPQLRKELFQRFKKMGFAFPNMVHPSAVIEPSVLLGEGNQIMMGACVGSAVQLGDNCIVNSGAIISHDTKLGDHCHIAPGAILAGGVSVGELAVVGMGVTVYLGVTIGNGIVINNGENVFRDIEGKPA